MINLSAYFKPNRIAEMRQYLLDFFNLKPGAIVQTFMGEAAYVCGNHSTNGESPNAVVVALGSFEWNLVPVVRKFCSICKKNGITPCVFTDTHRRAYYILVALNEPVQMSKMINAIFDMLLNAGAISLNMDFALLVVPTEVSIFRGRSKSNYRKVILDPDTGYEKPYDDQNPAYHQICKVNEKCFDRILGYS